MKRIITALLALLLLGTHACYAETVAFDHEILSNLDGYKYDKFEKSWSYYGAYLKEYSDATIVIGVDARGNKTSVEEISIYAWIRDEYNKETYSEVKEVMILADDHLITCPMIVLETQSGNMITPQSNEVLRLIAESEELAFKITFKTGSITLEPSAEDVAEFQTAAKNIYTYNLVSACKFDSETLELIERLYPITIE